MTTIRFEDVTKLYDNGVPAVSNLSLEVADGELLVLVGPSGCGKSTALRMIAGLEEISSGRLYIGGKLANDAAPRERNLAMVFQSYALYPHLTVADNIGFGLKVRGASRAAIAAAVADAARLLELTDVLGRKPANLSGGQRQRVAMGRALVRSPNAFLMDEPLSNLDARLRGQMRAEIARLQTRTGITTVYVTHDQIEAMTMGHRVAVMSRGVLQQLATPRELYDAPRTLFVAGFIGAPAMNFLEGTVEARDGRVWLSLGRHAIAEVEAAPGPVLAGMRPEALRPAAEAETAGVLPGRIVFVEDLGATLLVHVEVDGARVVAPGTVEPDDYASSHVRLRVTLDGTSRVQPGEAIRLIADTRRIHLFDPATGLALKR